MRRSQVALRVDMGVSQICDIICISLRAIDLAVPPAFVGRSGLAVKNGILTLCSGEISMILTYILKTDLIR